MEILSSENNKIQYKCDCGAKGFYTIKPLKRDAVLVIDIRCPLCLEIERVVVLQYSSEESRKSFLKNSNESNLDWTPIIEDDLVD
jgi:hypothetical protein